MRPQFAATVQAIDLSRRWLHLHCATSLVLRGLRNHHVLRSNPNCAPPWLFCTPSGQPVIRPGCPRRYLRRSRHHCGSIPVLRCIGGRPAWLYKIQNVVKMNVINHAVGVRLLWHRSAFEDDCRPIWHERQRDSDSSSELTLPVTPTDAGDLLAHVAHDSLCVSSNWSASPPSGRADDR